MWGTIITITAIEQADLEQFAVLGEELFGSGTNRANLTSVFAKIQADASYIFIGAKDERQKLLGSVMGIVCSDTVGECRPFMVLENIIVSRQSRRQGVGKKLMAYLEAQARAQNCYCIILLSHVRRQEAHSFYEAMGYPKDIVQGFKKIFVD
ncbi:GNAT family N-acetyltransferase [Sporomusa termitida]|uniref:Acetyltransferase (GNAT) family protein n=1 Tax=Sporomusa termitida TaxID=2377 RepID=A0A517DZZ1_9FIRM|nr:GNAT family N-acetyltransferase [Sporomusa termitida]QDR82922.1 Acetyltransferase (GNAT) family protein [Sporomusa termitida]